MEMNQVLTDSAQVLCCKDFQSLKQKGAAQFSHSGRLVLVTGQDSEV